MRKREQKEEPLVVNTLSQVLRDNSFTPQNSARPTKVSCFLKDDRRRLVSGAIRRPPVSFHRLLASVNFLWKELNPDPLSY